MSQAEIAHTAWRIPAAELAAAPTAAPPPPVFHNRTIWGLDLLQLHARYWAANGVQVVRQGEPSEIVRDAELFLLIDPGSLALFRLSPTLDTLNWINPDVLFLRLHDKRARGYREDVVTDDTDRFIRFQRVYRSSSRLARAALTPERDVAQLWQGAPDPLAGWRRLRKFTPRMQRTTQSIPGSLYDVADAREMAAFASDLMTYWKRPDATISRAHLSSIAKCWKDPAATVHPQAKCIGPVWVGAGRHVSAGTTVIGPAVVWDDPAARPATAPISWQHIEPSRPPAEPQPQHGSPFEDAFKRLFDICFALAGAIGTLWMYPIICLAIWIEDGRPFFFAHRRETIGGRQFPCRKFRSMRKDAERMKAELKKQNQADGPQFFMENDPRLTRVGRFLRKFNLDELPQFFNVLAGDMSVVGPRASPFSENQYNPAWREARLSVRAGITGLWQVKRTRRSGSDFQEWIKYDIEYVEKRNWRLDLLIIWKTVTNIFGKISKS